ncbi:MAG: hypothetical protein HC927_02665, partial [Deltaproteobacteria bacterium]|nr:hypothetical protein [Deltaproteobacteria bacterium]
MKGSEDGVGREFPLAIFEQIEGSQFATSFAGLPRAYAPFIAAASDLLERVDQSDPNHLPWLLDQLPQPDPVAVTQAYETGMYALTQVSADELLDRLFSRPTGNPEGDRWPDDHAFASAWRSALVRGWSAAPGRRRRSRSTARHLRHRAGVLARAGSSSAALVEPAELHVVDPPVPALARARQPRAQAARVARHARDLRRRRLADHPGRRGARRPRQRL